MQEAGGDCLKIECDALYHWNEDVGLGRVRGWGVTPDPKSALVSP